MPTLVKSYRSILFILLLFVSANTTAQTDLPALLKKLKTAKSQTNFTNDTANTSLLSAMAAKYTYNNPDSAMIFAKQELTMAKAQYYPKAEARANGDIAKIYYVLGYYYPSLDASDEAMAISKKINYQNGIAGAFNIKGLIYLAEDKVPDAVYEFSKALEVSERIKDSTKIASNYFDLGICYDETKSFDKAFFNLNKAIEVSRNIKDWHINLMALNRLGETYYHAKNYPFAIHYYQMVLDYKQYHDNWENSFAYSGLSQTYYALGQHDKAIANAKKSLRFSERMKASWDAERALQLLSKSYAASHDYKNAYLSQIELKATADSLLSETKQREINYLHLKEKKAENLQLIKENQANKQALNLNRLVIFTVSMVAILLIIVVLAINRNSRNKNRLNKELSARNADIALQKEEILKQKEALIAINNTKDQVFSIISHDLRSPFASILQSLSMIRYGDLDKEEQEAVFNGFYQEVNLVTGMINNLLIWASSQQAGNSINLQTIDLVEAASEVVSVSGFFAKNKNLQIEHEASLPLMIFADLNRVKIILQNLVGNAIKFTPQNGIIRLFYTQDDGYHIIHIRDTGIGMSEDKLAKLFKVAGQHISEQGTDKEIGTGLGLIMIKQFIEENNGRIAVESTPGEGSEFLVYFKKAKN